MRPSIEDRIFSLGCPIILSAVCALGYFTASGNWTYAIVAASFIGVWLVIARLRVKRLHRMHIAALKLAFAGSGLAVPHLKDGRHYSFPNFTLTFTSESELQRAEAAGCIRDFKKAIQTRYADSGSKGNPFDVERAVSTTYEGWMPGSRP
jgi:hypothetical protein